MKDTLQIALFQYEIEWQKPQANLKKIETLLHGISDVDVVVLPEAFNTGFSMEAEKVAETMDGFSLTEARRLAREYNVVLCGSLFVRDMHSRACCVTAFRFPYVKYSTGVNETTRTVYRALGKPD